MLDLDMAAGSLASRLGWDAGEPRALDLVNASVQMLDGHVDPVRCASMPETYAEAVVALGIKLADVGARGAVAWAEDSAWQPPSGQATAGLLKSVWAYVIPLSATGGAGVA